MNSSALQWRAFWGMLLRDLSVLRREFIAFLIRTVMNPLMFVFDTDIGGLLGLHLNQELKVDVPVVSIDGIELREFDYIDIGAMLETTGAVPVVIKSLIFPGSTAPVEA